MEGDGELRLTQASTALIAAGMTPLNTMTIDDLLAADLDSRGRLRDPSPHRATLPLADQRAGVVPVPGVVGQRDQPRHVANERCASGGRTSLPRPQRKPPRSVPISTRSYRPLQCSISIASRSATSERRPWVGFTRHLTGSGRPEAGCVTRHLTGSGRPEGRLSSPRHLTGSQSAVGRL